MNHHSSSKQSIYTKIFSALLIIGSLAWLGWIIANDVNGNLYAILPDNYIWLFFAFVTGVISQFNNAIIFSLLLRSSNLKTDFLRVSKLFFTGQIIRYIPGRVWGIFYQLLNTPSHIPKEKIVLANIELMFVVFTGLIVNSTSILLHYYDYPVLSMAFYILSVVCIVFVLLKGWLSYFLKVASQLLKRKQYNIIILPIDKRSIAIVLCVFLFSWVVYLLGWVALGQAGYGSSPYLMVVLAATYTLSWFIGYISMVTPSGLGVREASFLLLANGMAPASELAILAIVARVWLLLIDIFLFVLFVRVDLNRSSK